MEYKITEEQLESIDFFCRMFENHAAEIQRICETERGDIEYGFALGCMHTYIRTHFVDMLELTRCIRNQRIDTDSGE